MVYVHFGVILLVFPFTLRFRVIEAALKNDSNSNFLTSLNDMLLSFAPLDLSSLLSVATKNRVDTKFVFTSQQFFLALEFLRTSYKILEIDHLRLHRYQTLYFDTDRFDLYLSHHNGVRNRHKVRSRQYVDTDRAFFEVKKKVAPGRSVETRTETSRMITELTQDNKVFVEKNSSLVSHGRLSPKLWNQFSRITLLSHAGPERLTIDLHLSYNNGSKKLGIPNLVIAELKQGNINRQSPFFRYMRSQRIRPVGFSKYCVGVAMLYPNVKHNEINPKLRMVQKMTRRTQLV